MLLALSIQLELAPGGPGRLDQVEVLGHTAGWSCWDPAQSSQASGT